MHSRPTLLPVLTLVCALAAGGFTLAQNKSESTADFGVVGSQRLADGMPLGGIGCGAFELMTDGSVSRATINNNWDQPTGDIKGSFAAVWTSGGGKVVAKALQLKNPYGLPSANPVEFRGQFPQARLEFPDRELPVKVSLHAFSGLIPHDIKNSSLPAAVFLFRITNQARGPVDASIALSWENFLGVGGTAKEGAFADRTGNTVTKVPALDGRFAMRLGTRLTALRPESRTRYNATGNYALMAEAAAPETVVTTAGWNARDSSPGWWSKFATDGTVEGESGVGVEGSIHPAGVVAMKVSLNDGETRDLPFAVAWYTPRHWTSGASEYGHAYERSFSDAVGVARYALESRLASLALTDEWQSSLQRSTLPVWLTRKLMNDSAALFTNTILTRDSGLAGTEPGPSLFSVLESPVTAKGALGAMDHLHAASAMQGALIPRLHLQLLSHFRAAQAPSGEIPRILGNVDEELIPAPRGEKAFESDRRPDVQCSYAYLVFRHYRSAGDQKFLDEFYPSAKHAIQYAATLDTNGDGIPESAAQNSESYTASMWLETLRIAHRMAQIMRDRSFTSELNALMVKASARRNLANSHPVGQWLAESAGIHTDGPVDASIPQGQGPHAAAFQAALLARRGRTEDALRIVQEVERANWASGAPWQAPRAESGGPHIANASTWHFYNALLGFDIDLPEGTLTLSPRLSASQKVMSAPIFSPTFTAWLDYRPGIRRTTLSFRLDRYIPVAVQPVRLQTGVGLTLKKVVIPTHGASMPQVTASLGRAPVPGKATKDSESRIAFTFDSPLKLTAGHRLEFLLR